MSWMSAFGALTGAGIACGPTCLNGIVGGAFVGLTKSRKVKMLKLFLGNVKM